MAESAELAELAQRRRLLVQRSDDLRLHVAQEWHSFRERTAWVERAYALARSGTMLWPIVAAGLGLLLGRGRGSFLGKGARLLTFWRVAKKAFTIWQSFQAKT